LAQRLAKDLLRLSRSETIPSGVLGHQSLARNLFFFGRLPSCRSHLEEVLALHNPIFDGSLVHQVGIHPHVNSQAFFGIVLFCLGYPDLALAQSTAAIAEARRLAHPPSLASILALDAVLVSLVGDDGSLCERANEVAAVATEQGFPSWGAAGRSFAAGSRSKRRRDGRNIAHAQRFGRFPRHRVGGVDDLFFSRCWPGHARSQDKLKRL
jgi:hypothetical protein